MTRRKVGNNNNCTVSTKRRSSGIDPFDQRQNRRATRAEKSTHCSVDIKLTAKTEPQRQMIEAWCQGLNIFAIGSAGTGKTFVALSLALQELLANRVDRIVIVRSAVQSRQQGHLPGSIEEKMQPYEAAYKCIVNEILGNGTAYESLAKKGLIEFISTSFIRGITLDRCVVILDEFQNTDYLECQSVITRLGEDSRFIACGDTKQSDMERQREKSGIASIISIAEKVPEYFDVVRFLPNDIVRSGLVKAWILAEET